MSKLITSFKIFENAEEIEELGLSYEDADALPFSIQIIQGKTDEFIAHLGVFGGSHGNYLHGYNYPGRLWLNKKVMSFWEYPPKDEIIKVLEALQKAFNLDKNKKLHNKNIFDFKIEIFDLKKSLRYIFSEFGKKDSVEYSTYNKRTYQDKQSYQALEELKLIVNNKPKPDILKFGNVGFNYNFVVNDVESLINYIIDKVPEVELMKLFEQFGGEYEIVSIKEYLKLNNLMDAPKSELIQHLQSPLNKKNIKDRFPGWKPKKLKYQLPGEPEIMAKRRLPYLYQEKKKPE